ACTQRDVQCASQTPGKTQRRIIGREVGRQSLAHPLYASEGSQDAPVDVCLRFSLKRLICVTKLYEPCNGTVKLS
ncbi:hypothetical protein BaRGS_00000303, partial [Batillaria attramentaria]